MILRFILNAVKWLLIVVISTVAFYFIISNYNVISGIKTFVVKSGSMEPTIMTGDIVVIKRQDHYKIDDVVTFTKHGGSVVTHRLVEHDSKDSSKFITKGDANRDKDGDAISEDQIMGRVVLDIPRAGYYVVFIKTPFGLVLLFLIPVLIFILDELLKIKDDKELD